MPALDAFIADHGVVAVFIAAAILFTAGTVKGAIGFALPLISVSGLGMFLPAQLAVAITILPMIVSNFWQTFRTGFRPAMATLWRFRLLLAVLTPTIVLCSQLLAHLNDTIFYLSLGLGVTAFATSQLAGWRPAGARRAPKTAEVLAGIVGGFFGGLAGIWGPPVTLYLLAIELPKAEAMRALGVIFGLGSVALTIGQIGSGVLNAETGALSALALLPVLTGMALGFAIHDRVDQETFRKATLAALALTGVSLLGRAAIG